MTSTSLKKVSDWLLISLFFLALWLPLVDQLCHLDPKPIANENRNLAVKPQWQWNKKTIKNFPSKIEQYYNDHFGWRNSLLHLHSQLIVLGFNESVNKDIILGKEGWIFTANDKTLEDYQGKHSLSEKELAYFCANLEKRRDWLAKRNCKFLFILLPDKQSIYPEYLPDGLREKAARTRADQLSHYLGKYSNIDFLDARPLLRKAKSLGTLYYLTDTHWNDLGAGVVSQKIAEMLQKDFPAISDVSLSDFKIEQKLFSGDLAQNLGIPDLLQESAPTLVPLNNRRSAELSHPVYRITEINDENLPRALIHRDSFFNALWPFTSEFFRKAIYIWDYSLNTKIVEQEKPQVVILEMVERMIPKLPSLSAALRDSDLESDFKKSTNVFLDFNDSQNFQKIKMRNASISQSSKGWKIYPQDIKAQLVLPLFTFPTNQAVAIKVEVYSPIDTKLSMYYKIETDDSYRDWRKETKKIKTGLNECFFYFSHPLIAGRLRLDFPESEQAFELHRLEIRGVER